MLFKPNHSLLAVVWHGHTWGSLGFNAESLKKLDFSAFFSSWPTPSTVTTKQTWTAERSLSHHSCRWSWLIQTFHCCNNNTVINLLQPILSLPPDSKRYYRSECVTVHILVGAYFTRQTFEWGGGGSAFVTVRYLLYNVDLHELGLTSAAIATWHRCLPCYLLLKK